MHPYSRYIAALTLYLLSIFSAFASDYQTLVHSIGIRDWKAAAFAARQVDLEQNTDAFFSRYVQAARLTFEEQCPAAMPILEQLIQDAPQYIPLSELSFLCNKELGNGAGAIADLERIAAVMPNGPQRQLVGQMLATEKARHRVSTTIYAGITPSSNANKQTGSEKIGDYEIAPESRASAGVNALIGATFAKLLYADSRANLAGVVRTEIQYSTVDNTFVPGLAINLPYSLALDSQTSFVITPFVDLSFDNFQHSLTKIGAKGIVQQKIDSANVVAYQAEVARLAYVNSSYLDAYDIEFYINWSRAMSEETTLTLGARAAVFLSDDASRRRRDISLRSRVDHHAHSGWIVGAEATIGKQFHSQAAPFSVADNQIDSYLRTKFEISHRAIHWGDIRPVLTYTFQFQDSDNVFYQHQSHDVGLALKAKF